MIRPIAALIAGLALLTTATAQKPYQTQKGTEILWDKYGVPHIYAKSVPDMFFCFGWAQAEAHGDLLLHVMGGSRGRGAVVLRPGRSRRKPADRSLDMAE